MRKKDNLANYIKRNRLAAGLSQRDLSTKLGYTTPQFISNWERGLSHPPISILKKLADIIKVSPDDLFELTLNTIILEITLDLKKKYNSNF